MGSFFTFWGPNGLFLGLGKGSKTTLGSARVVEQLSFSMLRSILTFDLGLISGSFFTFWGPNGLFLELGWGFKNCFGVSSCRLKTFVF